MHRNDLDGFSKRSSVAAALLLAAAPGSAFAAIPAAASAASPPLVVGGVLVGMVLLGLFVGVLVRTMRTMRKSGTESRLDIARREVDQLLHEFQAEPSVETASHLLAGLKEADTAAEATLFADALSHVSGRYFGADMVAWEIWLRRDATAHVEGLRRAQSGVPTTGDSLRVS